MRSVLRLVVLALCLALPGSALAQQAAAPSYRLSTKGWIGDYRQTELADLIEIFGEPESTDRDDTGYSCSLRWPEHGLVVAASVYGTDTSDPCTDGIFSGAAMTGATWFTNSGLRVGSPASTAKSKGLRKCRAYECWNPKTGRMTRNGYVLSDHRNECAAARTPTLVALTSRGKVSGFLMRWLGCE